MENPIFTYEVDDPQTIIAENKKLKEERDELWTMVEECKTKKADLYQKIDQLQKQNKELQEENTILKVSNPDANAYTMINYMTNSYGSSANLLAHFLKEHGFPTRKITIDDLYIRIEFKNKKIDTKKLAKVLLVDEDIMNIVNKNKYKVIYIELGDII